MSNRFAWSCPSYIIPWRPMYSKREDIVTYLMLLLSTLRCVLTIKQAKFPGSVLHDARKARPPQESRSEVSSSGLLHFPPKGSLITADGARAFPNACQNDYSDKKFLFAAVNHQKNIFTKRYKYRQTLWGKRNRVIVAGTQQLDSSWRHLKKWRPVAFPQKKVIP